jgi:hypothetical protein
MLFFRHRAPQNSRLRALGRLFQKFRKENTPEARGLRLLRNWLSAEQRRQFDAEGGFDVIGCDTGKRYRIRYGISANVQEVDQKGTPLIGLCFVPLGYLVAGDVMLAQKIALETNEMSALKVANRFPPTPVGPRARVHQN